MFVNFAHLGHGTSVYYQGDGFNRQAPGTLVWNGQSVYPWLACPTAGVEFQVYQEVSPGIDFFANCTYISLSALDYTGSNPAAGSY